MQEKKKGEFHAELVYFNSFQRCPAGRGGLSFYLMADIEKSVLIGYSASQMFALVDAVEDYPKFLPWCGGSSVEPQDEAVTHATIMIDYHHIKHSFTTENTRRPPELIKMKLLDGPFQNLDGHWRFTPLADDACKIEFRLHYTFAHIFLEKLVGPVFFMIANSFVEAFIQRAEEVYGSS